MSKIARAFDHGKAFLGFLTAGDPDLAASEECVLAMARGGADLIEIGIPFSDPVAEGPVIQQANLRALAAGTRVEDCFALVERTRRAAGVPMVFLTYLNPVFHYGYEAFFARAEAAGLDGIIIPDLPFEEQDELRGVAARRGVDLISLIAPTSAQRVAQIAKRAAGFLYIVSSMGVTGERGEVTANLEETMRLVRQASDLPAAVGFGIHSPAQARAVASVADGVIVGSAIVRIIAEHGKNAAPAVERYVREMRCAVAR
jgi:tryptophan synthase alpha chain